MRLLCITLLLLLTTTGAEARRYHGTHTSPIHARAAASLAWWGVRQGVRASGTVLVPRRQLATLPPVSTSPRHGRREAGARVCAGAASRRQRVAGLRRELRWARNAYPR